MAWLRKKKKDPPRLQVKWCDPATAGVPVSYDRNQAFLGYKYKDKEYKQPYERTIWREPSN